MDTYKFFKSLNEKIKQYETTSDRLFQKKKKVVTIIWIEDVKIFQKNV